MLEILNIAECLMDYIGLAKGIILAFIAVIAFFKKFQLSDKRYPMPAIPKVIDLRTPAHKRLFGEQMRA
jgi:hypothetical protein